MVRENMMNRHEGRKKAMILVYQYLLYERDIEELLRNHFTEKELEKDSYIKEVILTAIQEKDRYIGYLNQVLEGWSFDRLGYIEQAILLCGCSEFDLKQIETPIIIDEYIELTKEFCDSDSYKLINGVLDRV